MGGLEILFPLHLDQGFWKPSQVATKVRARAIHDWLWAQYLETIEATVTLGYYLNKEAEEYAIGLADLWLWICAQKLFAEWVFLEMWK